MTKQAEDTMFEIYNKLEDLKIRPLFYKQLKKMEKQQEHKWKDMCERWEYAFNKVKNLN
jgi:hypothetical protein|tara:strand:- start:2353 stop:2529 length:177 start_codon:yes stop_codon:yes gene_type:complete